MMKLTPDHPAALWLLLVVAGSIFMLSILDFVLYYLAAMGR